jgi:hypothetical protein
MNGIALVLHSAELSTDELSLRLGFENTTDRAFSIIGRFEKHHVVLIDATGYAYEPLRISKNLHNISPPDGFAPAEANVGNIVFPRPLGSEPYELRLSQFDPIRFRLNSPLPAEALVKVTPGDYPLEMTLQSTNEALAPIELQVYSIRVETESLIFSVGFINTLSQGHKILASPIARDARLRDVEGTQYKPIAVSNSFQTSIAPEHGWEPDQEYVGTLTFPLPEALSEVSFIFPFYPKLTIRFNETGVAEVRVDSNN